MTTEQLKSNITFSIATIKALQVKGFLKEVPREYATLSNLANLMIGIRGLANYSPEIYADVAKGDEKFFQELSQEQRRFSRDTKPVVDDIVEIITKYYPSLIKETE